jgi:hypothetical protein
MSAYNYESFPIDMDAAVFAGFRDHIRPGDRAPDGALIDANTGESVRLSDYRRDGPLIVEFGSAS